MNTMNNKQSADKTNKQSPSNSQRSDVKQATKQTQQDSDKLGKQSSAKQTDKWQK